MSSYSAKCSSGSSGSTSINKVKITELPQGLTVTDDDLFVFVDDPTGTPVTQYITAANMKTYFTGTGVTFDPAVLLSTDGADGDLSYINAGDLNGAVYEKVAGAWTYIGQYRTAVRTAHPVTTNLTVGFQWMLIEQADASDNGIYEWDGVNIFQRASFGGGSATPGEAVTFVNVVPGAADGIDGDQALIIGGDLTGAIYEKQAGTWTFVALYREVPRTTHPSTVGMPSGFQWRLILQGDPTDNGLYEWDGTNIVQLISYNGSGSGLGGDGDGDGDANAYVSSVPGPADGVNGDQAFIVSGDLNGAIYEKIAGVWTYVTVYRDVPRTAHPATASLPAGFQWRLVQQVPATNNGLYEWDGSNIIQLS